ncbi:hypothetical protein N7523_010179 [Penicillium sp. IBT 18751x]|nr:hypothetical protein N7523_010179 [Penicillium sp. IBT 18751x]
MISLDRVLSDIWTLINTPSSQLKVNDERIEFLNFQLQKLIDNMPTEDFKSLEPTVDPPPCLQAGLKRFCRLRVHHIKILTRIGTSGSIKDLISQPKSAGALVPLAVQSVDLHVEMANAGGISPLLLPTAIKLLLSSLSITLLGVSHCPEEHGLMCSKPLHTAIGILSDVKSYVKDPDLNISGMLAALAKVAESSQSLHSQWSAPLNNGKEGPGNTVYQGEPFDQRNVFDELSTPDSEIFSMLGDVSMAATNMLRIDNLFG